MAQAKLKNILFDLGGVILDIDIQATLKAFYDLGFPAKLLQYPQSTDSDLYFKYETGKFGTEEFITAIEEHAGTKLDREGFKKAWNAMIVRIPQERTRLLDDLSKRYKIYMLSNTSSMHVEVFEEMYLQAAGKSMHDVFEKIYYSHEIGWRKPDREAWDYVIKDSGIRAEETLFIDDNIQNIKASKELGFQAIHLHERVTLTSLGFDL